ncbi:MAG: 50S ribosomal protein L6 [Candidatus Eremiobacteraeota bacterium]|nr:50S ribosomal protein L6 [Candidatus Eremiobacteraeota bacterium]
MSRIGKKPIVLPDRVTIDIDGNLVRVKGPRGELKHTLPEGITLEKENGHYLVRRSSDEKKQRAFHGLTRALIANMVKGVSTGFEKALQIVGVGYRATQQGKGIQILIGFSHPVNVTPPEGIELKVEGNNRILVRGIDKELVGQVAANIRKIKPPDVYKGKGILYEGEQIEKKAGKAAIG